MKPRPLNAPNISACDRDLRTRNKTIAASTSTGMEWTPYAREPSYCSTRSGVMSSSLCQLSSHG